MLSQSLRSRDAWENYRCFASLSNSKSMATSAKEVGLALPTFKQRIAELEQTSKLPLLEKVGRCLVFTKAGERAHRLCMAINKIACETENCGGKGTARTIRLSVDKLKVVHLLAPFLQSFSQADSPLNLEILSDVLPEYSIQFSTDVMLAWFDSEAPGIESKLAGFDDVACAASVEYLKKRGEITWSSLDQHTLIVPSDNSYSHEIKASFEKFLPYVKDVHVSSDFQSSFAAVANGFGFSIGPSWLSSEGLVPVWLCDLPQIPMYLTYRKKSMKDEIYQNFVFTLRDFLYSHYERYGFKERPVSQASLEKVILDRNMRKIEDKMGLQGSLPPEVLEASHKQFIRMKDVV